MNGRVVGRYLMHDEIASGGMASVHLGRLVGPAGFSRTVAIKVLHAAFAKDPDFVAMFLDEARLAARVRHPNVVSTLDVVVLGSELFLVMDYIQGESVSGLMRTREGRRAIPPAIAATIASEVLLGLHAAHEATDDQGGPLSIVHRDVSPQNVLVGLDGIARVVDFGVAKAAGRLQSTRDGQIKGKVAYMPPEQLRSDGVDRRADVYAMGVVLWEMLTGQRLFAGSSPEAAMVQVFEKVVEPPSSKVPHIPAALDAIVLRAVSRKPEDRFATAREMAAKLDDVMGREPSTRIGDWVHEMARETLDARAACVARIEGDGSASALPTPPSPPGGAPESTAASTTTEQVPSLIVTSSSFRGEPPHRTSRRTTLAITALGAAALALLSFGGYELGSHSVSANTAPPPAAVATPAIEAPRPSAPPEPSSDPSAAPAPPTAPLVQSSSPPKPQLVSRPARPPPRAPERKSCNPPFSIDANGYHVPKPECL